MKQAALSATSENPKVQKVSFELGGLVTTTLAQHVLIKGCKITEMQQKNICIVKEKMA